jgi:hypothetical protein
MPSRACPFGPASAWKERFLCKLMEDLSTSQVTGYVGNFPFFRSHRSKWIDLPTAD